MRLKNFYKLCLLTCLLVSFLLACSVLPSVSYQGTPIVSSSPDTTQNTPRLNTWIKASPGVELRYENWKGLADHQDSVSIVRLDLNQVHLSVGYRPTQPELLSDWMQAERATVIINGGYFDNNNRATGLVISNGETSGSSYEGFGGMLSVDGQGNVKLRSLSQEPYDPNSEQLRYATQSSPMLVANGKRTQFQANAANQRRSVVAQDTQGRLLFIVSPGQVFALDELADLVASSDLSIKTALNLDGGASTGLYVNAGDQHITINSFTQLPIAIIVK